MFDFDRRAQLVDELVAATRREAAAAAARWEVIGELVGWHCDDEDDASALCVIDGWEDAAADVAAACGLSPRAASGQMRIAVTLRDRLPKVAGLVAAGEISARTVSSICWRTHWVVDDEAMALIDVALAGIAPSLGVLSQDKAEKCIDVWIEKFDPAAVRRTRASMAALDVTFRGSDDPAGVTSFWGTLAATDAVHLEARITGLAQTVCDNDPRTAGQRRSAALGLLGVDMAAERLPCLCGTPECAGTGTVDPRSAAVTVYVLTDQLPQPVSDAPTPDPPEPDSGLHPGIVPGGAVIPATLLADLTTTGANVRTLASATTLTAEPRYRPSAKLATFVRLRDLVCTFPGCTRPATTSDLDHTIPWPAGATHPGNLSAKCRTHHLLKTFKDWHDTQHPDGTHTWTAPTGHTYPNAPMAAILFPGHTIPTPTPPAQPAPAEHPHRANAMPQRRHTRAHQRTTHIQAQRKYNQPDPDTKPPPY